MKVSVNEMLRVKHMLYFTTHTKSSIKSNTKNQTYFIQQINAKGSERRTSQRDSVAKII